MISQNILKKITTFAILRLVASLFLAAGFSAYPAMVAYAATITVNTTDDEINTDGDCSLREALQAANYDIARDACPAGSGADTIIVPAGTYLISIPTTYEDAGADGDLDIYSDMTIQGAGAGTTFIDGGRIDRVFHIPSIPDVTDEYSVNIYDVTIQNGLRDGDACEQDGGTCGGGINIENSTLNLERCVIRNNFATDYEGKGSGGGICIRGSEITLTDCAVINNTTETAGGGIKNVAGTLTLTNTTVSGNESLTYYTGGVYTGCTAITNFNHCTVVNNKTNGAYEGSAEAYHAAGINGNGPVSLYNTIVADNVNTYPSGETDCSGEFKSLGYNLIEDNSSCTIIGDTTGNIYNTDPELSALADNGGSTYTHAFTETSPVFNTGDLGFASPPDNDQRGAGFARVNSDRIDIGAFEFQYVPPVEPPPVEPPPVEPPPVEPPDVPEVKCVTSPTESCSSSVGTVITITVHFSVPVWVKGTPQLLLNTGGLVPEIAYYTGGSGTEMLTFSYTVVHGDNTSSLDYWSEWALELNDGRIYSNQDIDADLDLPVPGAPCSLSADTSKPCPAELCILGSIYPVYRFYNPGLLKHFYTIYEYEKEHLISANIWEFENIAYYAFHPLQYKTASRLQKNTLRAVHRFYSEALQTHLYTVDENEKDELFAEAADVWRYEGVVFYVPDGNQEGTIPIYRFYSDTLKEHLFTIDENEKNHLINTAGDVWHYEGIAYYAYP